MSYSTPRSSRYADHQSEQPRRGHRDSDATLVDYRPTKSPEPVHQRSRSKIINRGYDPSQNPYYDQQIRQPLRQPNHYRASYPNDNRPHRSSCLKRSRQNHSTNCNGDELSLRTSQQKRRSVHFDDNGDSYGFTNGDDDYEDLYTPSLMKSRLNNCDEYSETRRFDLPQPVTASEHPTGGVLWDYLIMPPRKTKITLLKSLKEAFAAITVDPDFIVLGCRPGNPTPQHILDKEVEEEAIEEAKRAEQRRKKEEDVRQSRLRRLNAYNAPMSERRAQEAQ
ncbi:hypothetical protein ACEPAG_2352 [Sanghuangporus baumii]